MPTSGFEDAIRDRNRVAVERDVSAYVGALAESMDAALNSGACGDDLAEKMRANAAAFRSALTEAIPAWASGHITLYPDAALEKIRAWRDGVEAALEDLDEPTERGTDLTTTLKKRSDVVAEATTKARELMEDDPGKYGDVATARAEVWRRRPDLAERYHQLPPEAPSRKAESPVVKGADVLLKVDAEARELMKVDPGLSEASARAEIWRRRPDLAEEYRRAIDG